MAEEVAIALATLDPDCDTIVSDSRTAINNYIKGRISQQALRILHLALHSTDNQITLVLIPAHASDVHPRLTNLNEVAHSLARGLVNRAGDNAALQALLQPDQAGITVTLLRAKLSSIRVRRSLHAAVTAAHHGETPVTKAVALSDYSSATAVLDYDNYVERIFSAPVSIQRSTLDTGKKGDAAVTTPATSAAYSGCGQTMGCFGTPKGCLSRGTCTLLLTYVARGDGVDFELIAPARHENMWIAAGISETPSMDMASVVECLRNKGVMSMRESWNSDGKKNIPIANQTPGLTFIKRDYYDGMLRCSWHRAHVTSVQKTTFNTATNSYHLLLAAGLFDGNTDVKKEHYERDYTKAPVNLKAMQVALGGAGSDIFIKLHGSLMIVAWVLLVSVGILLARHYKNVWEATTVCGVKPWFAFHRVLMMIAVAMMIAALVLIFYRVGQWSVTENPHPILGIVCSVLGFCQPIMALFRCHPHEDNRYIFNWAHWFNGNAGQIVAVATIFFAAGLEKAQLKGADWFVYILAAFVGFHVLVHIIMQLHSALMSKKVASNDIKMQDRSTANGVHAVEPGLDMEPPATDAPGGGFRRFMLGIYLVVAILVVAALVSTIWFATAP
ncbi:putative ferric-chelate reductase 1 homolog [Rhipicephalus sanguineus]|uniref:putative ferric-chelate reductase 1 homolog n=1 Tax=Rhipicephalus sanguineus TaxID=34632 RepID=UPI0020C3818D|nr:putative ferric-chelate reductase 1 homolog [Rhipicephalus sanguineus]